MGKPTLAQTAYHEAGHTVIACRLGYPAQTVTILPQDGYLGQARSDNPLYGRNPALDSLESGTDEKMRHRVIAALAGPVAERHFNPEIFDIEYSTADYEVVFDLVLRLGGGDNDVGEKLAEQVEALVLEQWPVIDLVARALLEHKTLEGEKLQKLLV